MLNQLFNTSFLIRAAALIVILLYVIFSLIVLNQVRVMNKIITQSSASFLVFLTAAIHSILAVSLFVFALAIL